MSKNFTVVMLPLFVCISASAQLEKGTRLLGGSIDFTRAKISQLNTDDTKNTSVGFTPSFGVFYRQNRLAGVRIWYGSSKNTIYTSKSRSYGGGVFLRQYLPLGKSFYVFAQEGLNYSRMKAEVANPAVFKSEEKVSDIGLHFFPGIAYNITSRLQLEVSLPTLIGASYDRRETKVYETSGEKSVKTNTFSLQTGTSYSTTGGLGFGIRFTL